MSKAAAHGKVILFGEHAVVYGIPALAVGIERGASASMVALDRGPSRLHVKGWNVDVTEHDELPLGRALAALLRVTPGVGPVAVDVEADLPPGGGLGCSAALGVAAARALDPAASSEVIAERANAWETVFHGNPSGIDAAVAAFGGCVLFQRGEEPSIQRVRMPHALMLCVGSTGQASSTKTMVEAVARLRERRPETAQKAFDAIHTLVKNARLAVEDGDVRAIGQLMDLNQMLLSALFVSTPEIEQMCGAAREAGAAGSKLTGAGGGGSVIAIVDSAAKGEAVLAAWKKDGFDGFVTTVGGIRERQAVLSLELALARAEGSP